jgi:hypothetical protein
MAYENIIGQNDGILDPKLLKKIWNQHQSGQYDRSAHLWALLMYRKWKNGTHASAPVPSPVAMPAYQV